MSPAFFCRVRVIRLGLVRPLFYPHSLPIPAGDRVERTMKVTIKVAIKRAADHYRLSAGAARGLSAVKAERTEILNARIERTQAYLRLLDLRLAQASGITQVDV